MSAKAYKFMMLRPYADDELLRMLAAVLIGAFVK